MLGYGQSDIGSSPEDWFNLVHPDDRERLRSMIDANLAGSITPIEHRYRIRHQDGSYRWMLARAEMLRDGAIVAVGRDLDDTGGRLSAALAFEGLDGVAADV